MVLLWIMEKAKNPSGLIGGRDPPTLPLDPPLHQIKTMKVIDMTCFGCCCIFSVHLVNVGPIG